MKKRRSTIVAVLLVLALALSIGYATLSRELMIGSEANLSPDENDFDIVFTDAAIQKQAAGEDTPTSADNAWGTASVTGGGRNAHYTLTGLSQKGDKAIMTFTITNRTQDVSATLMKLDTITGSLYVGEGTATPGNVSDYFDKAISVKMGGVTYNGTDAFAIPAGGTATVTITVTLKQTVTTKVSLTGASVILNFQDTASVTP